MARKSDIPARTATVVRAGARLPVYAALVAFLLLLSLPSGALAGPPVHSPLPAQDIEALDHACGTAVDSEGDVYASSAGESKIEVFGPADHGTPILEIANPNESCALAVDSQGNLYVSERGTGNVVRYDPNEYPPTPSTTYSETVIDASSNAKGISIDPSDDRLYVAEGDRIVTYTAEGKLGIAEVQRVIIANAATGSYKLCFEGKCTIPLNAGAEHGEVEDALQALETIGTNNVSVTQGSNPSPRDHLIRFQNFLGHVDLPLISVDNSELVGGTEFVFEETQGFDGHIAAGELSGATGVAAYTYGFQHYLFVAEPTADRIQVLVGSDIRALELGDPIDGSQTPDGELGLASEAYLGLDSKNGHVLVYDATHDLVNEFEATGQFFTQIVDGEFEDGEPTAIAVDRSGGPTDGAVYVSAGASIGARLLAFGAVVEPSRADLPDLSHQFVKACGTAVDSEGNLYVAGATQIAIYDSAGDQLASFEDKQNPCGLAVDSEGNLYAIEQGSLTTAGDEKVVLYEPSAFPFAGPPSYGAPQTIEALSPGGIAVNPANDRLFVSHGEGNRIIEYKSAKEGSGLLDPSFCGLAGNLAGIDVHGASGNVYVINQAGPEIDVCNADGSEVLARIDGSGSPDGTFDDLFALQIAVEQDNGHVLVGGMGSRGTVEEYEASGAFLAAFGSFTKTNALEERGDIALDGSGGPNHGNLYVAYDDTNNAANPFDLTAFGPLEYGAPPVALTGIAGAITPTGATLNATVDPNKAELEECAFEWGEAGQPYEHREPCAETPAQIGSGDGPVAVHLDLSGIEPETTGYRFRLVAKNQFGEDAGEQGLFGPPLLTAIGAQPILYREATLRAIVDPFGLATDYRFEYGTSPAYGQSTVLRSLPAGSAGPVEIEAFLAGLEQGTTYHFRLVAENEAAVVIGPDQQLTTQQRPPDQDCPNQTLRLESNSAALPDCRAYELVTPPDTRNRPHAEESALFNNWLVTPSGPLAGASLAFFLTNATLPGTEGNGLREGFRATRSPQGWSSAGLSPSYAQKGDFGIAPNQGTAADQLYSFWEIKEFDLLPGTLAPGEYLRTPAGFELLGAGSLGTDPKAEPDYVAPGGAHVIFSSAAHLEDAAAPAATVAIYDRQAGSQQAAVVSLRPDGSSFAAGQHAKYIDATPDGSAVVFTAAGNLYLRRGASESIQVTTFPEEFSFAAISADGRRLFYTDSSDPKEAAALRVCAVVAGSCDTEQIAADASFVNISADGSNAYFVSAGDLYLWDGDGTSLIAPLDPADFANTSSPAFPGTSSSLGVGLDAWAALCVGRLGAGEGAANCPSRTNSDGRFLAFQSHADLTPPYQAQGHSTIYRYDAAQDTILCVSCDPSGVPARGDADLQPLGLPSPSKPTTVIPAISEDGARVLFQTAVALLPEDANSVLDVYEWRAQGTAGCPRPGGCLALISSGQGDQASFIYSMTPDAHDVFFTTTEKLIPADILASPSIYDARIGGGFPQPTTTEPCHGDACQPLSGQSPQRAVIASAVPSTGNPRRTCPRGRRPVKRKGRVRCRKAHHHRKHRRSKPDRRAAR